MNALLSTLLFNSCDLWTLFFFFLVTLPPAVNKTARKIHIVAILTTLHDMHAEQLIHPYLQHLNITLI